MVNDTDEHYKIRIEILNKFKNTPERLFNKLDLNFDDLFVKIALDSEERREIRIVGIRSMDFNYEILADLVNDKSKRVVKSAQYRLDKECSLMV